MVTAASDHVCDLWHARRNQL